METVTAEDPDLDFLEDDEADVRGADGAADALMDDEVAPTRSETAAGAGETDVTVCGLQGTLLLESLGDAGLALVVVAVSIAAGACVTTCGLIDPEALLGSRRGKGTGEWRIRR